MDEPTKNEKDKIIYLTVNEKNEKLLVLTHLGGDLIVGIVILVIGILLRFVWIPQQIHTIYPDAYPNAQSLPVIYAYLMMILAIAIILRGFVLKENKKKIAYTFNLHGIRTIVIVFIILFATVAVYHVAPYIPVTAAMICVIMLLLGNRKPLQIIIISIVMPIVVYLLFTYGFKLVLP